MLNPRKTPEFHKLENANYFVSSSGSTKTEIFNPSSNSYTEFCPIKNTGSVISNSNKILITGYDESGTIQVSSY